MAALVLLVPVAPALAIEPPTVSTGAPPLDGPPGPEFPTKQNKACQTAGVLPNSDLSQPPPGAVALNLAKARTLSQGAGVTVAVIDTGVKPNTRLPNLVGGGDYVAAGGDGLADCDSHGTLVAGIIGAAASPNDGFVGVAPAARIISIRQRSGAFQPEKPAGGDNSAQVQLASEIRSLARSIVHAVNLGASVVTVSLPVCVDARSGVDQSSLSAAIGYAVHVRGALIVAGAGDTGSSGCQQNEDIDVTRLSDPRNWRDVKTISTPGWFVPDVLTVGFTTAAGAVMEHSLLGPWVTVAAPGTAIESLDPGGGGLVNGVGAPGNLVPVGGASYAAAYVSGVAALLRSRYPSETPAEIMARLQASAHAPARGVDNIVGAGVIDPMAALSYRAAPKPPSGLFRPAVLTVPPPARERDVRPAFIAGMVMIGAVILGVGASYAGSSSRRRKSDSPLPRKQR